MTPLVRLDVVDSTQRVALELAREGTAHGTCVVAHHQTAGRGRLGRAWVEPAEGLLCSLVLDVRCPVARASRVTLGAAVGMLEVMDVLALAAFIKWPNDIVVPCTAPQGRLGPFRKVAGLLVEVARTSPRDELEVVVLGLGVNLRAPEGGWPDDLARTAGALDGNRTSREDLLQAVRRKVPPAVGLAVHDFAPTLAALRARSATLGRRVEVEGVRGRAADLDDDGALVIIDDVGAPHTVRAGDVWLA